MMVLFSAGAPLIQLVFMLVGGWTLLQSGEESIAQLMSDCYPGLLVPSPSLIMALLETLPVVLTQLLKSWTLGIAADEL